MLKELIKELESLKNDERAINSSRFFKTWVWEYWEWDKFYWITVPTQRQLVKKYYSNITKWISWTKINLIINISWKI